MTPRILVPADTKFSESVNARVKGKDDAGRRSPALICESKENRFAPPNELFQEAMLENSSTKPPRRLRDFIVSAAVQVLFLAVLILLPLYFTEALDIHQLNSTLLVAPPAAPASAPPLVSARSAAPKPRILSVAGKLLAPRVIPKQVARLNEGSTDDDLVAPIIPGEGVPGGVSGGLPGGVVGGALSGAAPPPPAPISSAPKGPIRIDGQIKVPRLIFGPAPVYPVLAQRSRISGAVVIDAVIDTQGNVVEMRTVSGHPFLALAAMEALRRWKYEPTILGGEPVAVQLLVTLTFDNRRS